MEKSTDNSSTKAPETKPVPKEGDVPEVVTKPDEAKAPEQPKEQPEAQPAAAQAAPAPVESAVSEPATPVQQIPTAAAPEKKGGICNLTTCCIGSCLGCFGLIIVLVIVGIFAAPTMSRMLNNVVNPDVDVPEINSVSVASLNDEVAVITSTSGQHTVIVSEDEFNVLLRDDFADVEDMELDIRADFQEDIGYLYIKFVDWMPWSIIEYVGDADGGLVMGEVKIGPISVDSYLEDSVRSTYGESESYEEFDASSLFLGTVFPEGGVTLDEIHFLDDEVKMIVTVEELSTIGKVD